MSEADTYSSLRHDLRNRVNQIVGYSEMLIEEASDSEDHPFLPDLERIRTAGRGMLSLIESGFPDSRSPVSGDSDDSNPSLPGASVLPKEPSSSSEESAERAHQHGRLLIIDDIAENRALLARRLEMQGHQCASVASGREGLEQMRQARYDVVLLDLMMPEMDGFTVLQHIKSDPSLRNTPVIMISASDEMDSVVRCIEMGAADYLLKPFNPTLLRARVDACLREKRLRDREEELFQELEENYRRERQIADAMQRSLIEELPENLFPGLGIATLYEAAWAEAQIGGDLFDAFALPSGNVALAVADASGKGLAAAARIVQAKYVLRAYAREYEAEPDQIVNHLNDFLCGALPLEDTMGLSFVTLALAILNPQTGDCAFVCAGCEPPLVLRKGVRDGQTMATDADGSGEQVAAESIINHGPPLGIDCDSAYTIMRTVLGPGDALLMCTDGVTEARRGGALFGYDRMAHIAAEAVRDGSLSIRAIGITVLEAARAFGQGTLKDDACLLLARRNEN